MPSVITTSLHLRRRHARPWIVLVASVLLGWSRLASAQFVDATSGPLGDAGSGFGVAWGDYDNDGDLDLYLANSGQANKLFRNDGGGVFVDATSGPLGDTGQGTGVAWADYDNDGDLDLYLVNSGSANKLFRNDGGGTFVDVTSGPLGDTGQGRSVAWGDYDGDRDLDLFVTNLVGTSRLLRNDGSGAFTDVTLSDLSGIPDTNGSSYGAAWADYDNDFDLDLCFTIYAPPAGKGSRVLKNTIGNGKMGVFDFADTVDAAVGPAWGDYDNDGDLDLFLARYNRPSRLYRNDAGVFVNVTGNSLLAPVASVGNTRAAAWGDYDRDGDLDLYLVRNNQANKLFRNDGGMAFVDVTSGPLGDTGSGQCAAWGDYDNDGDPDLYISNSGQANKLLRNDTPAGNHWLKIRLQGVGSGRGGIGARVGIRTAAGWQIREISGGSNFASQDAPEALFGLGSATAVDSIYVRWPTGMVQGVSPPATVDQGITVVELALQAFTDVTSPATASTSFGVAWGDYDGDGNIDLFVGANRLLHNDGAVGFSQIAGALPTAASGGGAAWGDYDNDGDLDLACPVFGGLSQLFRNDGAGAFTDRSGVAGISSGQARSVSWSDYDQDGDLDLYVTYLDQVNRLFRNDGGSSFTDVTTSSGLGGAGSGWSAAWGDYDNDGDLDLFAATPSVPSQLYRNDGGFFSIVATGPATLVYAAVWGDYDNDGDLDLYTSMFPSAGTNKLYRNAGAGVFDDVTSDPLTGSGLGRGVAWGDYDNDGNLDLFIAAQSGPSQLLRNMGGGVFANCTSNHLGDIRSHYGTAWGDYDNDGDLDLYLADGGGTSTPSKLYRNNYSGSGAHWLRVKLQGTVSNRAAIGARVRVVAGGVTRIREISGGAGFMSQDGMVASFGLGSTATVDSVIVRWPSGIVQRVIPAPGVDQSITVVEAASVGVDQVADLPGALELTTGSPNPFSTGTRIAYGLPRAAIVSLTIHDLQGRQVVRLAEGQQPGGRHAAEWRGSDSAGRRVQAGMYFVRLSISGAEGIETRVRKVVLAN